MNSAQLLTSEQIQRIHDGSLDILETVGFHVRNEHAKTILANHGFTIDSETEIAKFPSRVVREYLACVPSRITFYARDEKYDRTLPDHRPVIMNA